MVFGVVGSCSVLFAKSLSNLLRLTMSSGYQFHSWFTYSMVLLFLITAGFWDCHSSMLSYSPNVSDCLDFFSICTGVVYFQEYQRGEAKLLTEDWEGESEDLKAAAQKSPQAATSTASINLPPTHRLAWL